MLTNELMLISCWYITTLSEFVWIKRKLLYNNNTTILLLRNQKINGLCTWVWCWAQIKCMWMEDTITCAHCIYWALWASLWVSQNTAYSGFNMTLPFSSDWNYVLCIFLSCIGVSHAEIEFENRIPYSSRMQNAFTLMD